MWGVEYTDEFGEWWDEFTEEQQEAIAVRVGFREESGPHLGDPYSSDIRGVCNGHMRELRIQSGRKHIRVFYDFDPRRIAILLIGGDRTLSGFFRRYVRRADNLYDEHLETERKD